MESSKQRLRGVGSIVPEMAELVVHGQSDSGAVGRLLKDQKIAEQACTIGDWAAGLSWAIASPTIIEARPRVPSRRDIIWVISRYSNATAPGGTTSMRRFEGGPRPLEPILLRDSNPIRSGLPRNGRDTEQLGKSMSPDAAVDRVSESRENQ